MTKLIPVAGIVALLAWAPARAQDNRVPEPSELTSRGVIAAAVGEAYRLAIESCYQGAPGNAPQGPQFLGCLKQQLASENDNLAGAVEAAASFLKSSPDRTAKLRNSQGAWTRFRDANCGFARAVAPADDAEAAYYDCLLRATVERRVELRSLIGD